MEKYYKKMTVIAKTGKEKGKELRLICLFSVFYQQIANRSKIILLLSKKPWF